MNARHATRSLVPRRVDGFKATASGSPRSVNVTQAAPAGRLRRAIFGGYPACWRGAGVYRRVVKHRGRRVGRVGVPSLLRELAPPRLGSHEEITLRRLTARLLSGGRGREVGSCNMCVKILRIRFGLALAANVSNRQAEKS